MLVLGLFFVSFVGSVVSVGFCYGVLDLVLVLDLVSCKAMIVACVNLCVDAFLLFFIWRVGKP